MDCDCCRKEILEREEYFYVFEPTHVEDNGEELDQWMSDRTMEGSVYCKKCFNEPTTKK